MKKILAIILVLSLLFTFPITVSAETHVHELEILDTTIEGMVNLWCNCGLDIYIPINNFACEHNFDDVYADKCSHNMRCVLCDYQVFDDHHWSYKLNRNGTHRIKCIDCNYTEVHNIEIDQDKTTAYSHSWLCDECGGIYQEESHIFIDGKCVYCDYKANSNFISGFLTDYTRNKDENRTSFYTIDITEPDGTTNTYTTYIDVNAYNIGDFVEFSTIGNYIVNIERIIDGEIVNDWSAFPLYTDHMNKFPLINENGYYDKITKSTDIKIKLIKMLENGGIKIKFQSDSQIELENFCIWNLMTQKRVTELDLDDKIVVYTPANPNLPSTILIIG